MFRIHHHFYDEDTHELVDCDENDIDPINLKKNIAINYVAQHAVFLYMALYILDIARGCLGYQKI